MLKNSEKALAEGSFEVRFSADISYFIFSLLATKLVLTTPLFNKYSL